MPKSSPSSPKPPTDSADVGLLRKKKNADAQAAFRARRQNYISTLEETVTSLESVVIQLQESCRDTRTENLDLRQEISRLRYENREREKYWKAFVQARKPGGDHPPSISCPSTIHPSSTILPPPDSYLSYRTPGPSTSQTYDNVGQHTPSVAFTNHDDVDGSSLPHGPDRGGKYTSYAYSIPDSQREAAWQLSTASLTAPQSQSPSYIESPSLTAPTDHLATGYPARFPTGDRKLDAVLSNAHYVFPSAGSRYQNIPDSMPTSRSMSPTTSASASSATSLPLTSSYQLSFQQDPSTGQDQADFEYRGQSLSHLPDVTLHGGLADISLAGQFPKRSDSVHPDNPDHLSILPQNHTLSQHEESTPRLRGNRRNIAHPYHRRSQSPGPTPLSSTVAVIKAQAFGALRRTRAKTKKTTDSAARVAQDVLEARGIGVGPAMHTRLDEGDDVGKS